MSKENKDQNLISKMARNCPFCKDKTLRIEVDKNAVMRTQCCGCGAYGPPVMLDGLSLPKSIKTAISRWNGTFTGV
jgi:hypothetical protein